MNTLKTTTLMALLTGLLVAVGGAVGGKSGASFMLIFSFIMNFASYWYSDKIVLKAYNAVPASERDLPELYVMVKKLAKNAGILMPRVYVIESNIPNAFATGRNQENGVIAVTTGIMRALSMDELAGVISHEMAHIKNRDTLISTVVASIAGVISWIGNMAQWAMIFGMGRNDDDDNGGLAGSLFAIIVAPLMATMIQLAISRSREYEADEEGGNICGQPLALARALEKIEECARYTELPKATPATSHLFIINPLSGSGRSMMSLFSTHPSTHDRVERLKKQAAKRIR